MFLCENALTLLFLPPVLHTPTELCILDELENTLNLVNIGTILTMVPQIGVTTCF